MGKRCRATMLWMAGTYLAAQLAAGLLLDHVWPQLRFPSAYQVFAMLEQAPPPGPEVVCLGSSRMGSAFQPAVIDAQLRQTTDVKGIRSANWTVPAGELVSCDYLFTELLERGARPRVLVLELVPDSLHRRMPWLEVAALRQWTWADLPDYFAECCRSGQIVRLLSARFQPLYVHRQSIWKQSWDWLTAEEPVVPPPRRRNRPGNKNQRQKQAPVPAQFGGPITPIDASQAGDSRLSVHGLHRQLLGYQVGSRAAGLLEHIYSQCREHGIELLLVIPPLASTYRDLYQPSIEPIFQAFLEEFCDRPGVACHDFRGAVPDELFLDRHHLTPAGGACFSRQLAEQVLAPRLELLNQVP